MGSISPLPNVSSMKGIKKKLKSNISNVIYI